MTKHHNIVVFCAANDDKEYNPLAYHTGKLLAKHTFTTITGGGPGMMLQVNKGAFEIGGHSIGVCIQNSKEKKHAYFTDFEIHETFKIRHEALIAQGDAFVVLPGGLGTILEAVEITQKKKFGYIPMNTPLIFVSDYYDKLLETFAWIDEQGFISDDIDKLYSHVQTPEEMIHTLKS